METFVLVLSLTAESDGYQRDLISTFSLSLTTTSDGCLHDLVSVFVFSLTVVSDDYLFQIQCTCTIQYPPV